MAELPPCGLYVTRAPIGTVPAGRLVYFHNHGDPGPGIYLPTRWVANGARFEQPGVLLPAPEAARSLEPLPAEGYYRVVEAFECCPNRCRRFESELLVQLGYDGAGTPIVFLPEVHDGVIRVPEMGTRIDRDRLAHLAPLKVAVTPPPDDRTWH
ncbi:MAG: hypothetical protein U0230_17365 [Polyangiales bacterium]